MATLSHPFSSPWEWHDSQHEKEHPGHRTATTFLGWVCMDCSDGGTWENGTPKELACCDRCGAHTKDWTRLVWTRNQWKALVSTPAVLCHGCLNEGYTVEVTEEA